MKRKLFSALLFGACLMASTSTFVSCKDYDDDIQNLQTQIDANKKAVEEIQKLIQSGSVITNVSSTANGVTVTLSNGNTFNVTNGKDGVNGADGKDGADGINGTDGKDGSVVTIGANGNWFIDGVDTGMAAQGPKGDKGDQGEKGEDGTAGSDAAITGEWYSLSADCSTLEYYKDGKNDPSKNILVADLIKKSGVVNAVKTDDVLALYNVGDSENPIIVISLRTKITALALWSTYKDIVEDYYYCDHQVTFTFAEQLENVFPTEAERVNEAPLKFKDKHFSAAPDESIIIRVTPANATVKASEITLLNSQGKDLSDFIECVAAEPYTPVLLTRSTDSKTGLYKLTLQLKDGYDAEKFAEAIEKEVNGRDESVVFAVAIDEQNADGNRYITSEWDVTVATEKAKPIWDFTVNNKNVNDIHNRYWYTEWPAPVYTGNIPELVWLQQDKPAVKAILETKGDDVKNANDRTDIYGSNIDNRYESQPLAVAIGEDINIDFSYDKDYNLNGGNIAGFYVALDYKFAVESAPSELAAWNAYSYEGVTKINVDGTIAEKGTLFTGNKGTIKVTKLTQGNYDIIGFRVFAVNVDGTLCDPDGRAFYVGVGEKKADDIVTGTILADKATAESDYINAEGVFVDCDRYDGWTAVKFKNEKGDDENREFTVLYYDSEKNQLNGPSADVKYVKFRINSRNFIDGQTYTQTIDLQKRQNNVEYTLKTVTAVMTKVMPTEFPKDFAFRPMQEIDGIEGSGIFRSYLRPQLESKPADMVAEYAIQNSDVKFGWTNFSDVFYGLDNDYQFIVKNTNKNDNEYTEDSYVEYKAKDPSIAYYFDDNYPLYGVASDLKLVDNTTKHDITANYLYRNCSRKWDAENKIYVTGDYPVSYNKNLQVIYSCWHHAESYAFAKDKAPQPQWTQEGKGTYVLLKDILAKSSYNDTFFGGDLKKLVVDNNWLDIVATDMYYGEQKNPYFVPRYDPDYTAGAAIVFEQKDTQVDHNPTADHVESLKITFKDSYGHEHDYILNVTVKKAAAAK